MSTHTFYPCDLVLTFVSTGSEDAQHDKVERETWFLFFTARVFQTAAGRQGS